MPIERTDSARYSRSRCNPHLCHRSAGRQDSWDHTSGPEPTPLSKLLRSSRSSKQKCALETPGIANGSRECAPDDKLRLLRQLVRTSRRTGFALAPCAPHPARSRDGSSGRSLTGSNGVRSVERASPSAISSACASPVDRCVEDAPYVMAGGHIVALASRHLADQRQAVLR